MAAFNVGDKVLINGGLVAEITTYDEPNNLIVYVTNSDGAGATDTTTAHISLTRIQPLGAALAELANAFTAPPVNHVTISDRVQGVIDVGGTRADALGGLE